MNRKNDLEDENIELLWLEIKTKNKAMLLGTIYRPPNSNNKFWDLLEENIDKVIELCYVNIIITGDINADP